MKFIKIIGITLNCFIVSASGIGAALSAPPYPKEEFSRTRDNDIFLDDAETLREGFQTAQYSFNGSDGLQKHLYKAPAIHSYHGAGLVTQPVFFKLPSEAWVNLPSSVKAFIAEEERPDIFFQVTIVKAWEDNLAPLALKPHYWNDPEAPFSQAGYSKSFKDQLGIFEPIPGDLRLNGKVNALYTGEVTTHQADGYVVSSGDTDHLTSGYIIKTDPIEDNLNLCFWSVVRGLTPRGLRTAVTLHWVTSQKEEETIKNINQTTSTPIEWARDAAISELLCAAPLEQLLGMSAGAAPYAGGSTSTGGSGASAVLSGRAPSPKADSSIATSTISTPKPLSALGASSSVIPAHAPTPAPVPAPSAGGSTSTSATGGSTSTSATGGAMSLAGAVTTSASAPISYTIDKDLPADLRSFARREATAVLNAVFDENAFLTYAMELSGKNVEDLNSDDLIRARRRLQE